MAIAVGSIYAVFIEGARNAAWTRVVPRVLDDFPQNVILWINYLRFSSIWCTCLHKPQQREQQGQQQQGSGACVEKKALIQDLQRYMALNE